MFAEFFVFSANGNFTNRSTSECPRDLRLQLIYHVSAVILVMMIMIFLFIIKMIMMMVVMMMNMLMIIMLLRHDIQVLYWLCRAHNTMFFDLKGAQAA